MQASHRLARGMRLAGGGLLARLEQHAAAGRTAIVDADGKSTSYADLLSSANAVGQRIRGERGFARGERVAFIAPPGADFVRTLIGVWQAGGVAVPLCVTHPEAELRYAVTEADACVVAAASETLAARAQSIAESERRAFFRVEECTTGDGDGGGDGGGGGGGDDDGAAARDGDEEEPALIIFTSGTTGRPKGVVLSHANLRAHMSSLVAAWEWTPTDRILHVLPLHHLHGLGNKLLCALWSGASVAFSPPAPAEVWARLGRAEQDGLTLFMAVPTNYALLLREAERRGAEDALISRGAAGARALRLMVSGSMALPTPVLERWRQLTGHTLLERYGMSELGMALSNPLHGERVRGAVGSPLPGVEVEIRDASSGALVPRGDELGGELLVRGAGVFKEYFRRPDATAAAFDKDGWFITGDHASCDADGVYRILGRASVDVIKSAGYKISALEVERELLAHPEVEEVAVVGVQDEAFGQRVAAIVVRAAGEAEVAEASLQSQVQSRAEAQAQLLQTLRADCAGRLAPYKLPSMVRVVPEIPKNAMGKINKKSLLHLFDDA